MQTITKQIDMKSIEEAVIMLLTAVGDDPTREGLKGTPNRVARMYAEMFEGMNYTNEQIAHMNNVCFEEGDEKTNSRNLVVMSNIPIFSHCEHHLALMYNMKAHVSYIPEGKVIGLSKIARIADMAAKRLQLQERLGTDISEILQIVMGTDNVAVVIEGEHACVASRGVNKGNIITTTSTLGGKFATNAELRAEMLQLIGRAAK